MLELSNQIRQRSHFRLPARMKAPATSLADAAVRTTTSGRVSCKQYGEYTIINSYSVHTHIALELYRFAVLLLCILLLGIRHLRSTISK